jgi:hypothetical protein
MISLRSTFVDGLVTKSEQNALSIHKSGETVICNVMIRGDGCAVTARGVWRGLSSAFSLGEIAEGVHA